MERIAEASPRLTARIGKATEMKDMKVRLSTSWIFAVCNYVYAHVFTVMDPSTDTGAVPVTHGFMLGAAVLMEAAIVMIPLSRFLNYRANRWASIVAGVIHTAAVILTLFVGGKMPASYYVYFASTEIASTSAIVWYAWKWPWPLNSPQSLAVLRRNARSHTVPLNSLLTFAGPRNFPTNLGF
jgi:hypothetical protein